MISGLLEFKKDNDNQEMSFLGLRRVLVQQCVRILNNYINVTTLQYSKL